MFKVRGVGNLGAGIEGGGDSTYRCNDSMYDEDRGLISESEDGWNEKEKGEINENKIDDISEHTSEECTDSEPEEHQEGQEIVPKKPKKPKGEKKKKKKKKYLEDGTECPPSTVVAQAVVVA